ncbi:hypothetical protein C7N43_09000 [Sphingobacteriales bacterium UPWRP_1]|nr:hypothetical protein B6N25_08665 [Sphingobacteriales bacterium TSM_CSS]PSJ77361.1 hypothetical protein C7N43_09000 [Sphingobacteriales bacterium UPWRP_1]
MPDKLHELVQNLSGGEMRYFRQFAARSHKSSEKNYLHLFDEMVRLLKYDETILVDRLKKKGVNTQFLAADKNYLYRQIMKSLLIFYSEARSGLQAKSLIGQIEILYHKGLYEHCSKLMRQCKKLAQEKEQFGLLVDLLHWQRKIEGIHYSLEQAENLFNEIEQALDKLNNYNAYNRLYYRIMLFRKQYNKIRTPEDLQHLNTIMQHPLLVSETCAKSKTATIRYYEIYANYYHLLQNKDLEYKANTQICALLDDDYLQNSPFDYLAYFSRTLSLQQYVEPDKFEKTLEIIKNLPSLLKSPTTGFYAMAFTYTARIEMNRAIKSKQFDSALALIEPQEKQLVKYNNFISDEFKMTACYHFAYIYLVHGNLAKALHYINNIINNFEETTRPDVYVYARIMQILLHYELKNYRILPYLVRSVTELLQSRKNLFEPEKLVLKFFQKIHTVSNEKEHIQEINNLKKYFTDKISKNSLEYKILDYFDFIAWLNSKINNTSFYQAMLTQPS